MQYFLPPLCNVKVKKFKSEVRLLTLVPYYLGKIKKQINVIEFAIIAPHYMTVIRLVLTVQPFNKVNHQTDVGS